MLREIFTQIFNMSITAGYTIIAVMLARLLFRKAPKKFSYMLWSVVGFRLAVPFSFQSIFSLFSLKPFNMAKAQNTDSNILEYIPQIIDPAEASTDISIGIPEVNTVINNSAYNASLSAEVNIIDKFVGIFSQIWLWVMLAILLYGTVSYVALTIKMRKAVLKYDNIYESDKVHSPFILGFISPKIYIPFGLDSKSRDFVTAHEKCHLKRYDYYIKAFAFVLLAVHWFNPLCWAAFALMTADMEMSCDEKVLSESNEIRREYSTALLSFAARRNFISKTPLCFSENSVKARIKNVLKFKKPHLLISILAGILCLAIIIGCAANPIKERLNYAHSDNNYPNSQSFDSLITDAILNNEKSDYYYGDCISGESHILFGTADGDINGNNKDEYLCIYAYTQVVNLSVKNNILSEISGSAHPLAIAVQKKNGSYIFKEYKMPREETEYFRNDVIRIFPENILSKYNEFISDTETYNSKIRSMKQEAYAQAVEMHSINTGLCIDAAFKSFDTTGFSSNPGDYIDKNSKAYNSLINLDKYTVEYIYSKFSEGRQYDIYGHFYRIVLDDISGEGIETTAENGQQYFNEFLAHNRNMAEKNGYEFMKANYPYGCMLLDMIDGRGNTAKIESIANIIRSVQEKDFERYGSVPEMISSLTGAEYIDDVGSRFYIYKFEYGSSISFYISLEDPKEFRPIGVTYYLNDMEYGYQRYHGTLEITTQLTDKTSAVSESVDVISPQKALATAISETMKKKYSEYFYMLRGESTAPSLVYRPDISGKFVYNDTAEYAYCVGLNINKDDDECNTCIVWINAESGEVAAVDFYNTYDMV